MSMLSRPSIFILVLLCVSGCLPPFVSVCLWRPNQISPDRHVMFVDANGFYTLGKTYSLSRLEQFVKSDTIASVTIDLLNGSRMKPDSIAFSTSQILVFNSAAANVIPLDSIRSLTLRGPTPWTQISQEMLIYAGLVDGMLLLGQLYRPDKHEGLELSTIAIGTGIGAILGALVGNATRHVETVLLNDYKFHEDF